MNRRPSSSLGQCFASVFALVLLAHCSSSSPELGDTPPGGETSEAGGGKGDSGKTGGKNDGGKPGKDSGTPGDDTGGDDSGTGDTGGDDSGPSGDCGAWKTGTLTGYNNSNSGDDP